MFTNLRLVGLLLLLSCAIPAFAQPETIATINLTNQQSIGMMGDAANDKLSVNLFTALEGGDALVTGFGWDLSIDAFPPSWLSQASISIAPDGAAPIIDFAPGEGVDSSGVGSFTSGGIMPVMGGPFVIPDGLLEIELYESVDDIIPGPDAQYLEVSQLFIEWERVPEPTFCLLWPLVGVLLFRRPQQR